MKLEFHKRIEDEEWYLTPEDLAKVDLTQITEHQVNELLEYAKQASGFVEEAKPKATFSSMKECRQPYATDELLAELREFVKCRIEDKYDDHMFTGADELRKADEALLARIDRRLKLMPFEEHEWELSIESYGGDNMISLRCTDPCDDSRCGCHTDILEWAGLGLHEMPVKLKLTGGGRDYWTGEYDAPDAELFLITCKECRGTEHKHAINCSIFQHSQHGLLNEAKETLEAFLTADEAGVDYEALGPEIERLWRVYRKLEKVNQ